MGRSVSYANGSVIKEYIDTSYIKDEFMWAEFKDELKRVLMSRYKSLSPCESNKWLDQEDLAILENDLVYIGISEYCGLTCLWVVPKEDTYGNTNLAEFFCEQIKDGFHKLVSNNFAALRRLGGFSDGTSVYERVNA